jgi:hypothetical protein
MFQFPRFPSSPYAFSDSIRPLARTGVAPFGFGWLSARLQLPSHVSPYSAPFFGLWPLGIHPTPFSAWHSIFMCQRLFYASYDTIQGRGKHGPLARFGKIEVHHDMRLSKYIVTSYWQLESEKQHDCTALQKEQ